MARQNIVDTVVNVTKFYNQASYGGQDVQMDVTTHVGLLNNANDYHRANSADAYPNIDSAVLDQLMAECAQGAVGQGLDLNDSHPLLSAFNMKQFGSYVGANVFVHDWDRSSFSETSDIGADDLVQDGDPSRVHLVEIRIGSGISRLKSR